MPAFIATTTIAGDGVSTSIVGNLTSVPAGQSLYITTITVKAVWVAATPFAELVVGLSNGIAVAPSVQLIESFASPAAAAGMDEQVITYDVPLIVPGATSFVNIWMAGTGAVFPVTTFGKATVTGYTL